MFPGELMIARLSAANDCSEAVWVGLAIGSSGQGIMLVSGKLTSASTVDFGPPKKTCRNLMVGERLP